MLVILKENVDNLGRIGEVVKVSAGFARNFLLPKGLGMIADESSLTKLEHQKKSLAKKIKAELETNEQMAKKLAGVTVTISRKVGHNDKLFGSVTNHDIAVALTQQGVELDKRLIVLDEPIKALGVHEVSVRFQPEVIATLKVWVTKETEN